MYGYEHLICIAEPEFLVRRTSCPESGLMRLAWIPRMADDDKPAGGDRVSRITRHEKKKRDILDEHSHRAHWSGGYGRFHNTFM